MPWTRPWSGDSLKQLTCFFHLEISILLSFLVVLQPAHCAQSSSIQGEASNAVNGSEYRLPGEVLPLSYNLSLLIDMENLVTEGEVQIKLTVTRPTSNITLHANQSFLSIKHDQVRVEFEDSPKVGVLGHLGDEEEMRRKDFYVVLLNQTLETGQTVMLTIPFTGKVSDSVDPSDPITCSSINNCSGEDTSGVKEHQLGLCIGVFDISISRYISTIVQNIDIDEKLYRSEFGISNTPTCTCPRTLLEAF